MNVRRRDCVYLCVRLNAFTFRLFDGFPLHLHPILGVNIKRCGNIFSVQIGPGQQIFYINLQLNIHILFNKTRRRSQWPRGLRHEMSSPAQTLGSWVQTPLEARVSECFYSVFMLSCICTGLVTSSSPSKESYRLSTWLIISELILNGNRPESLIRRGRRRKRLLRAHKKYRQ
jgi:hypothetical protein